VRVEVQGTRTAGQRLGQGDAHRAIDEARDLHSGRISAPSPAPSSSTGQESVYHHVAVDSSLRQTSSIQPGGPAAAAGSENLRGQAEGPRAWRGELGRWRRSGFSLGGGVCVRAGASGVAGQQAREARCQREGRVPAGVGPKILADGFPRDGPGGQHGGGEIDGTWARTTRNSRNSDGGAPEMVEPGDPGGLSPDNRPLGCRALGARMPNWAWPKRKSRFPPIALGPWRPARLRVESARPRWATPSRRPPRRKTLIVTPCRAAPRFLHGAR